MHSTGQGRLEPVVLHRTCGGARKRLSNVSIVLGLCLACERLRDRGPWDLAGSKLVVRYRDGRTACPNYLHKGTIVIENTP
jgi:hypothetical protein